MMSLYETEKLISILSGIHNILKSQFSTLSSIQVTFDEREKPHNLQRHDSELDWAIQWISANLLVKPQAKRNGFLSHLFRSYEQQHCSKYWIGVHPLSNRSTEITENYDGAVSQRKNRRETEGGREREEEKIVFFLKILLKYFWGIVYMKSNNNK